MLLIIIENSSEMNRLLGFAVEENEAEAAGRGSLRCGEQIVML